MTPPLLALWLLCGHGVIGGVPDRPHISQAPSIAPGDIGALRQEANRGDYEAQLKLAGALRTDAKGKKKVEALQWLTIAATLAPADQQERIKGERDALGREMKPKEVASAQERAAKWIDSFKASQPPQAAPPAPSPPSVSQAGSNSIESPQLVSQVRPAYTEEAKRKKIEGVVVVQAICTPRRHRRLGQGAALARPHVRPRPGGSQSRPSMAIHSRKVLWRAGCGPDHHRADVHAQVVRRPFPLGVRAQT